jgi:hypothetical protein
MKCHPLCPFSIARGCVDDETLGSVLYTGGEFFGATHGRRQIFKVALGEEEEEEQEKHPDILACRPCGLVFAHACSFEDHQIRGCPVDEPPAKRCKREDDGVEGTYGYELECYLKDLPATVCCTEELPARVENRAQSFVVNTASCDREGTQWVTS